MFEYFLQLIDFLEVPFDGTEQLKEAGRRVHADGAAALTAAIDRFYAEDFPCEDAVAAWHPVADRLGIPHKTMDFLFLAFASYRMREDYRTAGYDDALFWNTIRDFRCKLIECHKVYQVWGIDCALWYRSFFQLKLFWLGRLQYELVPNFMNAPATVGGYTLQPGEEVVNVHIPSSGPLDRASRMESYRMAYEFFSEKRAGGPLLCVCGSWLLFPANREIFPARLNTVDFMNDWKIVDILYTQYTDLWRVFGMPYPGNFKALPRDNTMQRCLADWLEANPGKPTGEGFALMAFDGEKVITD